MTETSPRGGASAPPRSGSGLSRDWPGRQRRPAALGYFLERAEEVGASEALAKARAEGRRAIGVFCSFIPDELIIALNAVPVRLCGGSPAVEDSGGLPRDTCPVVRAALVRLETAPLADLIDGVIVPTTCDWKVQAVRRLSARVPVWEVEVSRAADPEALVREFRRLADELADVTDFSLSARSLRRAADVVNRARAACRRIGVLRRRPLPSISGCEAMLVADTYGYGDIAGWTTACQALADELESEQPAGALRPRILLAGSPIIWPNFKVPSLVENTGGVVVGDDFCSRWSRLHAPDIQPGSLREMLEALARRALEPCTCGVLGQHAERERVVAQTRELDAHGVLCHYLRGCAPVAAGQSGVTRALQDAGLPTLAIETDAAEEDVEGLRTRIEAFLELVNTRG